MHSSQNHIINKVYLEVNTTDEKTANRIKNNISSFLNNNVFPDLEKLFDKYDFKEQVLRFDKLDLDFNLQNWESEDGIKQELIKCIQQKIEEEIPTSKLSPNPKLTSAKAHNSERSVNQKRITKEDNYNKILLLFLENGFLPWYANNAYSGELRSMYKWQQSLTETALLTDLTTLLSSNNSALTRLIHQFTNEQIVYLIQKIGRIQINNNISFLSFLEGLELGERQEILQLFLKISLSKTENDAQFLAFVNRKLLNGDNTKISRQEVINWNDEFIASIDSFVNQKSISTFFTITEIEAEKIAKEIDFAGTHSSVESEEFAKAHLENKPTIFLQEFVNSEREKEPPYFESDKKEIVVRNAGLVLFHPFLNSFFTQLGWINEKGKITTQHQLKAVQALHYCATGIDNYFEADLLLEKFLCGVSLGTSIPYQSLLTSRIKKEVDVMATELIKHWPALKNTSPDGLREMFIHRNGKLHHSERGFKLIVERKVQDILLDRLQWSISIVKLPWREELLFVEW